MDKTIRFAMLALAALPLACAAQNEGSGACRADVQRFCAATAGAGGEKVMDCLIDHQKEISDACYSALKARLEQNRGADACKADAVQFCKGVQPGGGRVVECLIDHQKEISDGCYESLRARKSGSAGAAAPQMAVTPSSTIYRSRLPDGRILYSDAPPRLASEQREVPMDRVITVAPLR
jgi:hypothetical protein